MRGVSPRIFRFLHQEKIAMQWNYISPLKVFECIERLSNPDVGRVDELNFFRVEITKISNSQMHLVYKGRRFSKDMRTEFLLSFSANTDSTVTMITVAFQREMFHLPWPMTPITHMDEFLKLTIDACRVD